MQSARTLELVAMLSELQSPLVSFSRASHPIGNILYDGNQGALINAPGSCSAAPALGLAMFACNCSLVPD
jgi:hypothetical protein